MYWFIVSNGAGISCVYGISKFDIVDKYTQFKPVPSQIKTLYSGVPVMYCIVYCFPINYVHVQSACTDIIDVAVEPK